MAWNRLVRPIETSLGCHLRGMRAPAHGGNATNHTERPLYLSKLHAKVVGVLQRDWVGFPGTQSRPTRASLGARAAVGMLPDLVIISLAINQGISRRDVPTGGVTGREPRHAGPTHGRSQAVPDTGVTYPPRSAPQMYGCRVCGTIACARWCLD